MGSSTKSIIKDVVIIVVAIAVIWLGLQAVFGTSNPFYVVSSGSMIPALEVYDGIVVEGNTPFDDVKKGDPLVEVESAKVNSEVESPGDGKIGKILSKDIDEIL